MRSHVVHHKIKIGLILITLSFNALAEEQFDSGTFDPTVNPVSLGLLALTNKAGAYTVVAEGASAADTNPISEVASASDLVTISQSIVNPLTGELTCPDNPDNPDPAFALYESVYVSSSATGAHIDTDGQSIYGHAVNLSDVPSDYYECRLTAYGAMWYWWSLDPAVASGITVSDDYYVLDPNDPYRLY